MQFLSEFSDGVAGGISRYFRYLAFFALRAHSTEIEPVTCDPRSDTHCNGMGHAARPCRNAGCEADGGWAVVSAEEVEIHPSSDVSPYIEGRLWDDQAWPISGNVFLTKPAQPSN